MKAIELLLNQEDIIPEELNSNKKIKALASALKNLMTEMQSQINKFNEFTASQVDGERSSKIIIAKSLAQFFSGNKLLKVDAAVEALKAEEKAVMNNYYAVKTQLLDNLRAILKESNKEAVVSAFDIFNNEFTKCEQGHEILILEGRNTTVIESLIRDLDESLIIEGNIDKINGQEVDFNLSTLNQNIELCNRKNNEIYGSKPAKLEKAEAVIDKLKEVGTQVVAFFTYKEALFDIGVSSKGIKDYENELSKAYIPLKKALQKEFKIELEDICDVKVDEQQYGEVSFNDSLPQESNLFEETSTYEQSPAEETNSTFSSFEETTSNFSPAEEISSPFSQMETPTTIEPVSNNPFDNNFDTTESFNTSESSSNNPFLTESSNESSQNPFNSTPFDNSIFTGSSSTTNNNPFDN